MKTLIGNYGPTWREGVLSEHLHIAEGFGLRARVSRDGHAEVTNSDGDSWPILCSELMEIRTEDGMIVGRCGQPTIYNAGANQYIWCEAHDMSAWADECEHGMSAALCAGPGHYPADH